MNEGAKCDDCINQEVCDKRQFILAVLRIMVTPRLMITMAFVIITIFQLMMGG